VAVIFVNTIILGMDHHPISESEEEWREVANYFFLVIFCLEFLLKLLGLGWAGYIKDTSNSFDFFVLMTSLIEIVIAWFGLGNEASQAL
jgi:hypothetical protein